MSDEDKALLVVAQIEGRVRPLPFKHGSYKWHVKGYPSRTARLSWRSPYLLRWIMARTDSDVVRILRRDNV